MKTDLIIMKLQFYKKKNLLTCFHVFYCIKFLGLFGLEKSVKKKLEGTGRKFCFKKVSALEVIIVVYFYPCTMKIFTLTDFRYKLVPLLKD